MKVCRLAVMVVFCFLQLPSAAQQDEYLDHMLFWASADLENKLLDFRNYYEPPSHAALTGRSNAGYADVTTGR